MTAAFFGEKKTENLPGFYAYGRVDKDAVLVFGGEKPVRISLKQYHDKQFSFLRRLRASDKAAFDRARDEGTEKHPFAVYREMNALNEQLHAVEKELKQEQSELNKLKKTEKSK